MRERARARRRDVAGWWRVGAAVAGGVALQMERERDQGRRRWPAAMASTPRSLSPERIRTDPAATARESARGGRNRAPRHVRRRVPQPPCPGPARAAARPSPPRLRTRAGRPAAAAPLRRADMGGERGLRAVATSGGLATSVRVVVGGGGGRGGRRSGARPPGAAPEAGIEREKGERAGRARGRLGRWVGRRERMD